MNLASELERLNCCQNSWYICLSLWNYTAKAQAQDLHFQHVHSQQTRGWGGGEGVLLGAESRGQTPGGSKFKKKKTHLSVLAIVPVWSDCKYFSLSHCVSSNLSWPVFLAQTTQPDVCLQLFSFHPTTADTHTHTQDLIWNTELKPLAVAYHELTSLPSRHQF